MIGSFFGQNNRLDGDNREVEITFTQSAIFAYDAVWSMARSLDAMLVELPSVCGSGVSLGSFDPLERGTERETGRCMAALFTSNINALNFNGLSVSCFHYPKTTRSDAFGGP